MAIQTTFIAVQVVVSPRNTAHACNMEVFFRQLGSSIAISLAENIFLSSISSPLQKFFPEGGKSILETGIQTFVNLSKELPTVEQQQIKSVLDYGINKAFILPLVATCVAVVVSLRIEWIKIKEEEVAPVSIEMT